MRPGILGDVKSFADGLSVVFLKETSKFGYINSKGEWAIYPQFSDAKEFCDGVAKVELNRKKGLIDTTGKWIIEPEADSITRCAQSGIYLVEINNKYGFKNKTGEWTAPTIFEEASKCGDESSTVFMAVRLDGKIGILDPTKHYDSEEAWIVKPCFTDEIKLWQNFNSEFIVAKLDNKYGFIDHDGEWVIEPKFKDIDPFSDG